jgi:hypothetical protein
MFLYIFKGIQMHLMPCTAKTVQVFLLGSIVFNVF